MVQSLDIKQGVLFYPYCQAKTCFQESIKGLNSDLKSVTLNFFLLVIEEIINSISQ